MMSIPEKANAIPGRHGRIAAGMQPWAVQLLGRAFNNPNVKWDSATRRCSSVVRLRSIQKLFNQWFGGRGEVVMERRRVEVDDLMQQGYVYLLTEPVGRNFHCDFSPQLTPQEMLALGVFGGRYMTDCAREYPATWFESARLCPSRHDPELNCFGVNASQTLAVWRAKGWIYHEDPRGWFQWYCRYFLGRRCPDDERQIKRWRAVRRHVRQLEKNCSRGDLDCRRKQRQALLHWAYDSRRI